MEIKIIFITFILILSGCCDTALMPGDPECLEDRFNDFKDQSLCEGASIEEYTFQLQTVYVLNSNCCCDIAAEVIDDACNSLGYLGGFQGNTIIMGKIFQMPCMSGLCGKSKIK